MNLLLAPLSHIGIGDLLGTGTVQVINLDTIINRPNIRPKVKSIAGVGRSNSPL